MLSVNQLNASIKLLEIWKALNIPNYPIVIKQQNAESKQIHTRGDTNQRPIEIGRKELTKSTCISDAIRVWNRALITVTSSLTVAQAKKEIKSFVKSLPI